MNKQHRLYALQDLFAALAIVLLLQVGTRFDTTVGTVSEGGTYGPLHSGPKRVRKSSSLKQAERAKLRNPSSSASKSASSKSASKAASSTATSSKASSAAASSTLSALDQFIKDGTGTCLSDRTCTTDVQQLANKHDCSKDASCKAVLRSWWLQYWFAPECIGGSCRALDALVRAGTLPPATLTCIDDQRCRSMLAEFRAGEVGCIRDEACHAALQELMNHSECTALGWCKNVSLLHEHYRTHVAECANPDSASCKTAHVKNMLAAESRNEYDCVMDMQCHHALINLSSRLTSDANSACYLWKACREYMAEQKKWACDTVKRDDLCKLYGGYLQFFKDKPTCVALSYTQTCKDGLKKAMGK